MKYQFLRSKIVWTLAFSCILSYSVKAQGKQEYGSLSDALRSGGNLNGNPGPQSVNWTNGGAKYSYIDNNEIHSMDPQTLKDELIFNNSPYARKSLNLRNK